MYTIAKRYVTMCTVEIFLGEHRGTIMVEPSSFDKLVGTTLGNYRLERCIMRGELGPTFLAHADKGSTSYLLRVLAVPTELTAEARIVYLGRFQQEANQVATLQQTYI